LLGLYIINEHALMFINNCDFCFIG
jgi:hypothetical protein